MRQTIKSPPPNGAPPARAWWSGKRLAAALLAGAILSGGSLSGASAAGWADPAQTGQAQARADITQATYYGKPDRHGSYSKYQRHDWRHFRRGQERRFDRRYAKRSNFRRCEEITSLKRFGYGRRAVIAETVCRDKFGRPFVVRGSRRVVGFLR